VRAYLHRVPALLYDLAAIVVSWPLAYALRYNFAIPGVEYRAIVAVIAGAAPIYVVLFTAFGLYSAMWRYASLHDLRRIVLAVLAGAAAIPALFVLLRVGEHVPRSVLVLQPLLLMFLVGGSRIALRAWRERSVSLLVNPNSVPILVLGAGDAAAALIRELSKQTTWRIAGLLDDDPRKKGRELLGHRIFGPLSDLARVAEQLDVRHAVIAMPAATHRDRRRAVELCKAMNLEVRTVPSYSDLVSGHVSVSQLRDVELDDLLGRDPVQLDSAGLEHLIARKTVLVTGAGGSIGAELCRQIARFSPARLVLFELSEFALYAIEQEFRDQYPETDIAAVVGDVKHGPRVAEIMRQYRPDLVFHAAAYKHVPLMEENNAFEALRNNVLGTYTVAREAQSAGVGRFVMVSTDKAVNPTNVMGASKRLAEMLCQALARGTTTQFIVVRFGNVLGSNGSVIPRFREQILRGGPVTVTHPEIQRYFMSIPEAAQLVLQAALMGRDGEIFVLDMGEPVRIVDLARQLIRLSGLSEDDVKIVFTGLRPGEKLYEELLADAERTVSTRHPKLRIAVSAAAPGGDMVEQVITWLEASARADGEVRAQLECWVPEYRPALGEPRAEALKKA
jgi:FlaA1/EpsC-like NDP-sugar epimerase